MHYAITDKILQLFPMHVGSISMTDTGGLLDFSLESSFARQTRFPMRIRN